MIRSLAVASILGLVVLTAPVAASTAVSANQSTPTFIGVFGAGSYTVTGSGLIDLVGPVGSGFTIRPDGTPDTPVTAPGYAYFNPSGSYTADGNFGPGGTVAKIGALMGTFLAAPVSPADYFLIGYGTTITLAGPTTLYAQVNDTFYPNNGDAFQVDVAAVPEPAAWVLLIGGFAVTGVAMRARRTALPA